MPGEALPHARQQPEADTSAPVVAPESPPRGKLDADLYDQLLDAIKDMDKDAVSGYLVRKKRIPDGGWLDDLSETQATWILEHVKTFQANVAEFSKISP